MKFTSEDSYDDSRLIGAAISRWKCDSAGYSSCFDINIQCEIISANFDSLLMMSRGQSVADQ
ncbi:hypothetical protein T11_9805 [Trichinella zimbabwensis]|uniref:Uncharacterized protein n=1 Tax=Trichinella zimbabwensis TaxID=268475 RepID=A0A0V1H0X4_9BILA|nr:hypothetical protein T11_9805 [Trichinella zimbabwensis]